jgi:hypothetical protein
VFAKVVSEKRVGDEKPFDLIKADDSGRHDHAAKPVAHVAITPAQLVVERSDAGQANPSVMLGIGYAFGKFETALARFGPKCRVLCRVTEIEHGVTPADKLRLGVFQL